MSQESPRDDPTIPDDQVLWRRVPPWHAALDKHRGVRVVSSAAFDDDNDAEPMSVVLASEASGTDSVLAGHDGYALVGFPASLARELGLGILRDPTDDQPAHAVVVGKKTGSIQKKLRNGAHWIVHPLEWSDVHLP